ncbi:hypothetical protein [Streptomyces mirabilis]|uniref:hypothetical protein n=1 Tax=Streptomyces mirabilis TaxID=68239 RepID=UPI003827A803
MDGSDGAQLNPGNGIILQMIERPGNAYVAEAKRQLIEVCCPLLRKVVCPVNVDGKMMNVGVYTEPTGDPAKDAMVMCADAVSGYRRGSGAYRRRPAARPRPSP